MQTKQLHIRLTVDEMAELDSIAKECETNPTVLAGYFLRASLRAAKSYGRRLRVPIDFDVVDTVLREESGRYRLNEAPPAKPAKRT